MANWEIYQGTLDGRIRASQAKATCSCLKEWPAVEVFSHAIAPPKGGRHQGYLPPEQIATFNKSLLEHIGENCQVTVFIDKVE